MQSPPGFRRPTLSPSSTCAPVSKPPIEVAAPSTRQYSRIVNSWVGLIGLDPMAYGTHSMRRTKADLSQDQECSCCATVAWTHETGEHRTLPRYRGGRRA